MKVTYHTNKEFCAYIVTKEADGKVQKTVYAWPRHKAKK